MTTTQSVSDDLATFPDVEVITTCSSPEKAQKIILRVQPDILFLDVEMPEMTGIELLHRMQPELPPDIKVVFYTAFDKYLIDALRTSAFDFLQKPYMIDELKAIIDRFRSSTPKSKTTLEQSLHKLLAQDKNTFAIQAYSGLMLVSFERILLFDYTREHRCWQMMFTDNNKPQRLRQTTTAKELLAISKNFVQISQECIVNLNYISTIENRSLRCVFCHPHDAIERTVSQRNFKKKGSSWRSFSLIYSYSFLGNTDDADNADKHRFFIIRENPRYPCHLRSL